MRESVTHQTWHSYWANLQAATRTLPSAMSSVPLAIGIFSLLMAALTFGQTNPTPSSVNSATVKESTRDVTIKKPDKTRPDAARVGDTMRGRDVLRTGAPGSMVDLEFDFNNALYRLASGSLFSFDAETGKLYLTHGLSLIMVEDGKLVCETCKLLCQTKCTAILEVFAADKRTTGHTGCTTKFILLEGSGVVSTLDGKQRRSLRGGQMLLQFEDELELAQVQEVDIKRLVK